MVCSGCISIFSVAEHGQSSRKGPAGQTYGDLPCAVFGLSLLTPNICHIASEDCSYFLRPFYVVSPALVVSVA